MTSTRYVIYGSRRTVLNSAQIPDALKNDVPDHVKERAREMARQELARRLEELNMSAGDAKGYGSLLTAVEGHIAQLHDLLEREWLDCDTDLVTC